MKAKYWLMDLFTKLTNGKKWDILKKQHAAMGSCDAAITGK